MNYCGPTRVFSTDYTYNNLKPLIKDKSVVEIPGDKDSAIVIMDKNDYVKRQQIY